MKLTFVLRMRWNMPSDFSQFRSSKKSKIEPRHDQRGEQARRHADGQRHAEALDFARAHENQNDGRNQRRDVRVENRAERAGVTGGDGAAQRFALGQFLAQALVNQHVRVHRHADGEHHARDARQGERRADGAHDAQQDDDVRDERDVRRETGHPVINQHERETKMTAQTDAWTPLRIESRPSVGATS